MAWRMLGDRPLLPQGDGAAAWGAVAPDAPAALSRADSTFGPRPKTNGSSSTSGSSADGSRSGPASAGPHQVVAGGRADHGSGGAASGSVAAAGSGHAGGRELSTMDVVLVQTASSCLAGMTSAGVTSPLDLVKTRIQVRPCVGTACTAVLLWGVKGCMSTEGGCKRRLQGRCCGPTAVARPQGRSLMPPCSTETEQNGTHCASVGILPPRMD